MTAPRRGGPMARKREAEAKRDELSAHLDRLRKAVLDAIHIIPGGDVKAELRDAYDEAPEVCLACHDLLTQAEALEHRADCIMEESGYLENFRREVAGILRNDAKDKRQQAKELKSD